MRGDLSKIMMRQFIDFCEDEATFSCNEGVSSHCRKRAVMMLAYAFGVRTIWHKRNKDGVVDLDVWSSKVRLLGNVE